MLDRLEKNIYLHLAAVRTPPSFRVPKHVLHRLVADLRYHRVLCRYVFMHVGRYFMSMCNLFLAILVIMLSQVQLYVVLLVVGWGESCMAGFSLSQHFAQYLVTVCVFCPFQEAGTLCSRHIPSISAGSVGRQTTLRTFAVTPHISSLRRGGCTDTHTVRQAMWALSAEESTEFFVSLFPSRVPFA